MMIKRSWKNYLDFVVKVEPAAPGKFRVEAQGPAGEAENTFALPFDEKDITIFLLQVRQQRRAPSRGRIPEPMQHTVEFGSRLYDAVLSGAVRDLFIASRQSAAQRGLGLRLRLRLQNAPSLADLPWEFLYDGRNFLALSNDLPLVHYLDLPDPPRPLKVSLPLRVLVTISSPRDGSLPALDVEQERTRIQAAVSRLAAAGQIEIDFTPDASLKTLQRVLRSARSQGRPYHIWHFIGHGGFDPASQGSILALADENGLTALVNGFQLGTLFDSYPEIRLVLLNSCEGARASRSDPFSGVAAALVERGIPAVIGMQFEVSDTAAIAFSEEFYAALVDGLPIDAALTEARRAIFFLPNWVEWATPILFMRSPNGMLFNIQTGAPAARPREAEQAEQERQAAGAQRLAAEKAEQERLAAFEAEQERQAAEAQRLATENAEQERLAAEKLEQERLAAFEAEQERQAAEAQRLAAEKAEQERLAAEKAAQEWQATEARFRAEQKAEQERQAAEAQQLAAERAEQQRPAAANAEQERQAAEKVEQERLAAAKAERMRLAANRTELEQHAAKARWMEAEKAEQNKLAAERADRERQDAVKAEQVRLAAARAEQERRAAFQTTAAPPQTREPAREQPAPSGPEQKQPAGRPAGKSPGLPASEWRWLSIALAAAGIALVLLIASFATFTTLRNLAAAKQTTTVTLLQGSSQTTGPLVAHETAAPPDAKITHAAETLSAAVTATHAVPPTAQTPMPLLAPSDGVILEDEFDASLSDHWITWGEPVPEIKQGFGDLYLDLRGDGSASAGIASREGLAIRNSPGTIIEFDGQLPPGSGANLLMFDWAPDTNSRSLNPLDTFMLHLQISRDRVSIGALLTNDECFTNLDGERRHTYRIAIGENQTVMLSVDDAAKPACVIQMGMDPTNGWIAFSGAGWVTRVKVTGPPP